MQGDVISREVYIKPPKEAEASDFWRLLKCVYSLRDASRLGLLRLDSTLRELGLES